MPIIDIISPNPSTILALNQQGYLISWNISAQKLAKHNIKDFPFLPHDWYEKVLEGNGIALICVSGFVVVCGEKEIKVVGVEEIGHGRVGDGKGQIGWKSVRQEDQIQSVTLINKCISTEDMQDQNNESNQKSNFTLLYSTKSGKIFYTQLTKLHPTLLCSLSQSQLPASSHAHSHSHHHSWNEYVTCMSPFRDNNLLLVGTNMGRVLIINLVSMKVVEDVSARSGVRGGFCRQIFVNDGDYRFYTVQQKGVFQWFIELLKCQGYYAYPSPYCAISTQKLSFDCQKILIIGGSKQLQIIDSQDPKKRSQLQLNIEYINVIKEIENKIYLGGRNNTIQVLQLGITYLILFKAEQSSFA